MVICPKCGYQTYILDTRTRPDENIRRRRQCEKCGHRFTTIEVEVNEFEKVWEQKSYENCFLNEEYSNQNCKLCQYRKRCLNE